MPGVRKRFAKPRSLALASPVLLTHISCVRGSPLIRTFLILAALVVSGIGFARLTQKGTAATGQQGVEMAASSEKISAKVFLTFSEAAGSVHLNSGDQGILAGLPGNVVGLPGNGEKMTWREFSSEITIEKKEPLIFLNVVWAQDSGNHRFAKMVVEAEGEETFTHVFDADGDIDDFVELPF